MEHDAGGIDDAAQRGPLQVGQSARDQVVDGSSGGAGIAGGFRGHGAFRQPPRHAGNRASLPAIRSTTSCTEGRSRRAESVTNSMVAFEAAHGRAGMLYWFRDTFTQSGRGSAWLERLVRDQEVGGSNPLAPTNLFY